MGLLDMITGAVKNRAQKVTDNYKSNPGTQAVDLGIDFVKGMKSGVDKLSRFGLGIPQDIQSRASNFFKPLQSLSVFAREPQGIISPLPQATPTPVAPTRVMPNIKRSQITEQEIRSAQGLNWGGATPTPTKIATPTPTPMPNKITISGIKGENYTLPQKMTDSLMTTFDPIGEATNAARALVHPWEQTFNPQEVKRVGRENWTYGENPDLVTSNIDRPNADGSTDRGLFRINSNTFAGMLADPFWRKKMSAKGITSYDDMEDMKKNIEMARLILERGNWDTKRQSIRKNPSYGQWYAAPRNLRER